MMQYDQYISDNAMWSVYIWWCNVISTVRADEDNDDVIESYSLYYIFSVFPSFVYHYGDQYMSDDAIWSVHIW